MNKNTTEGHISKPPPKKKKGLIGMQGAVENDQWCKLQHNNNNKKT